MKSSNSSLYISIKRFIKNTITYFFGNRRYKKFIIIGQQRTGSSLLANLLRSHPKLEVGGEPFRVLEDKSCQEVWDHNFGKKLPWIRYVGFKLFYYHPEDSDDKKVWDLLDADKEIKIIHIKRENMLRSFVSKKIAKKTGAWNSRQEGVTVKTEDKRITIDIKECLDEFSKTKSLEAGCGKERFKDHDYLEMTYEEFVADLPQEFSKVLHFLDVPQIEVKSALKRQNPEAIQDLVSNYQEVEDALKETSFSYLVQNNTVTAKPKAV